MFAAALLASACLLGLGVATASGADFTWSGLTPNSATSTNWSNGTNWVGSTAPSGTVGTLTFPALTSSACTANPPSSACYTGNDDFTALSANAISIDDGVGYDLSGNEITLGSGGLTAAPSVDDTGSVPQLDFPIALGANETWSIAGGAQNQQQLSIGGAVSGATKTLGFAFSDQGFLSLFANAEVGAVTATGSGEIGLYGTSLNGTDGNPVSLSAAGLFADFAGSKVGPLTSTGSQIQVGQGSSPDGTLAVDGGVTLDPASAVLLFIDQAGTTPSTDYSQITASGTVTLGNAKLLLNAAGPCPALSLGDVDTLISTTGSISGTFSGVPDGTTVPLRSCTGTAPVLQINYTTHTVIATVVNASGVPTNISPPTISGTTIQAQTLTESHGKWTDSPSTYGYQWQDCDSSGNGCTAIPGATSQTYKLTAADICHTIRVQETATNANGTSDPASSAATDIVSADSNDFTWVGGYNDQSDQEDWSTATNWAGCAAPSGVVGTLTIPGACPVDGLCTTTDDVSGLTASTLTVVAPSSPPEARDAGWLIAGNDTLTLTAGLSTTEQSTTAGALTSSPLIEVPIALGGPNTWTIGPETALTGNVSGATDTLDIKLLQGTILSLAGASNEVGAVTITGENFPGEDGGVVLGQGDGRPGDLNGTDGHTVTVTGGGLAGSGSVGPLTMTGGGVSAGDSCSGGSCPSGNLNLAVHGALSLHSGSSVLSTLVPGSTGTTSPHITATGPASLGSSMLELFACNLSSGTSYTLVDAAGGLSGTFSSSENFGTPVTISNGAIVQASPTTDSSSNPLCFSGPYLRINYTAHTVTATVVLPPTVTTGTASGITETTATVSGSVNPNGSKVSDCHFEYGTTTAYGSTVPCSQTVGAGTAAVAVSAQFSGLTPNAVYHFRLVATNAVGKSIGADATFSVLSSCLGPATAANVFVQGIEVTQGVQTIPFPDTAEGCYTSPSDSQSHPGAEYPSGQWRYPESTPAGTSIARYIKLVQGKTTVVRVFAATYATSPTLPVAIRLYVFRNGQPVSGPLSPISGPRSLASGMPFDIPYYTERIDPSGAYEFTIPGSWLYGNVTLVAQLNPPGSSAVPECASCGVDDIFSLSQITFTQTRSVAIHPVELNESGAGAAAGFPSASSVFSTEPLVLPVADGKLIVPARYEGYIDLSELAQEAPALPQGIGLPLFATQLYCCVNGNYPSLSTNPINYYVGVDEQTAGQTAVGTPVSAVDPFRPLTSVAHEMGHGFGLPHAGAACPNSSGEPWPIDDRGFLQGIGLDMSASSGGYYRLIRSANTAGEAISPTLLNQQVYDLMSYCVGYLGASTSQWEAGSWISPINWNRLVDALASGGGVEGAAVKHVDPRDAIAHSTVARGPALRVLANVTSAGAAIDFVAPTRAVATANASPSAYHLLTRDRSGRVLANVGMQVEQVETYMGPSLTLLSAIVPAAGARGIVITKSGTIVAQRTRSTHPPRIRVLAPKPGTVVGACKARRRRCTVRIRWRTRGGNARMLAFIDYSPDGGRRWQTIFVGPNTGIAALPATLFSHSRSARVRIRVNDGFDERTAESSRFTAAPEPPAVVITSPKPGERVARGASLYLSGWAQTDSGNSLTGSSLRWYIGRRSVGTGTELIITKLLPVGNVKVRLTAREGHRLKNAAVVQVHVFATP